MPAQEPAKETAAVAEKKGVTVVISDFATKKIAVIKAIQSATGASLLEAKNALEGDSPKVEGLSKEVAEKLKAEIEKAGRKAEIK